MVERRRQESAILHLTLVVLILWSVFALCVETFLQDGLWTDEVWSLWAVQPTSFLEMLARVRQDYHPPLYFVLLDGWIALVGDSVPAIRLPSTYFALLSAAVTYAIGKRLFDGKTGLISVVLLGSSGFFRYYAGETRMYSLLLLLSALCMYRYLCWLHQPSLSQNIFCGLLLASTIYTHYFSGWLILTQGVHLLLFRRERLAAWLGSVGLAFILFLPWLPVLADQIGRRPASFGMATLSGSISVINGVLSMATSGLGIAMLLPYVLLPDLCRLRQHRSSLILVFFWLIMPLAAALCFSAWGKAIIFHPRYSIGLLPAGALLVAFGVRSASRKLPSMALLIVILIVPFTTYRRFWPSRSDAYEEVFRELTDERTETDFLVLDLHPDNLVGYYDRHGQLGLREQAAIDLTNSPYSASDIDKLIDDLPQDTPIWLALPSNLARTWHIFSVLGETHHPDYGSGIQNMLFYRFIPGSGTHLEYQFGSHLGRVEAWSLRQLTAEQGTPVCLEVVLEALQPIDDSYSAGVHIVDQSNRSLAQWDGGVGVLEPSDERLLALCLEGSEALPPGEYDIQVSIYNWQTLARLPVFEVSTGHKVYWGDILFFGHVYVQDLPEP